MMKYEEYTTAEKKAKESEKEKDKTELSNDAYAVIQFIEYLTNKLEKLNKSLLR